MYIYIHIYKYIYILIYVCMFVCIYIYLCISISIYLCIYTGGDKVASRMKQANASTVLNLVLVSFDSGLICVVVCFFVCLCV